MTTAPDLPSGLLPAAIPAQPISPAADPTRAPLVLVPPPAPSESEFGEVVDFEEALRAAFPRLQRYAARRLCDAHEAEEVVQEALLRAFQHREALRTEDDLMAWLTVVTGRLVIDRLRVRGRSMPVAELPATSRTGRDTAEVVVARDEARIALDALEAMPARQAAVLWAREVEGLSYDDIGDRYGLSEPTVRSLLHRARRTLRREYAERGGTLPALGLIPLAPWLRGLRIAGRLRSAARRGGATMVTAATGLALATIAPLWSAPTHTHVQAAPAAPYIVNARTTDLPAKPAVKHVAVAHHSVRATAAAPVKVRTIPTFVPRACTRSGVGVACTTHNAPTLYVTVAHHDFGVSVGGDVVPAVCAVTPATPLTHCDPSDRKH